jgi:hypothetical protein
LNDKPLSKFVIGVKPYDAFAGLGSSVNKKAAVCSAMTGPIPLGQHYIIDRHVQYVVDGKQRTYRISRLYGRTTDNSHLSLQDAPIEAGSIRSLARNGIDYQVKLKSDREAEAQRQAAELAAADTRRRLEQTESLTLTDLFHANGTRAATARSIIRCASCGFVANSTSSGTFAALRRFLSSTQSLGKYSSRSINARPRSLA